MADIVIDFTGTTPTFSPNPFHIHTSKPFTIKVFAPSGSNAPTPTLLLPPSAGMTPAFQGSKGVDLWLYTCTAASSQEKVQLTAKLPEMNGGQGEKTASGEIDVSNSPVP